LDVVSTRLTFTNSIKQSFGEPKTADSDSESVYLRLTVTNSSHEGRSFIPQNNLKIIIGDNSFDAEDLDSSLDYIKNIEPTLSRTRECYFELPKSLVKDSILLRFTAFLSANSDVPVSTAATAPMARSLVGAPQSIPPTRPPSADTSLVTKAASPNQKLSPNAVKSARLTILKNKVGLSGDQEAKAKPIIDKYVDDRLAANGDHAILVALKVNFDSAIDAILTSDQGKRWDAYRRASQPKN
jgi:hypothetical protein